jgi:hypothetical protein
MWVRRFSDRGIPQDPEWLRELAKFLIKSGNGKKFETVKKIFYENYLENVREGMTPEEAIQKAKSIALCFLFFQ